MSVVRDPQVQNLELFFFFAATILISAAYVFLSGMIEPASGPEAAQTWYANKALVIVWAPMLCAVAAALLFRGRSGARMLLQRLLVWRVPLRWWLIALCLPPLTVLVPGILLDDLVAGDVFSLIIFWLGYFAFLSLLMLGEEVGWRGYALPALQAKMSPFQACLLLGCLWGAWHFPVWFGREFGASGDTGSALIAMFAGVVLTLSMTFVMAWLANHTRASILLAVVFHGGNNASLRLFETPSSSAAYYVLMLMICAITILVLDRKTFFKAP